MMEKYGVDQEHDDVEVRATELIKTGEYKTITEARIAAQKEREGLWKDGQTSTSKGFSV